MRARESSRHGEGHCEIVIIPADVHFTHSFPCSMGSLLRRISWRRWSMHSSNVSAFTSSISVLRPSTDPLLIVKKSLPDCCKRLLNNPLCSHSQMSCVNAPIVECRILASHSNPISASDFIARTGLRRLANVMTGVTRSCVIKCSDDWLDPEPLSKLEMMFLR